MDLGSHSLDHRNPLGLNEKEKYDEVYCSKKIIEQTVERRVIAFSYPTGNISKGIERLLKDAGYEFSVTTRSGVNDLDNCYALKRINIWQGTSLSSNGGFAKGFFCYKLLGY